MELFRITKGNVLEIDDINILLVKEFADVYKRDKSANKKIAFEELKYIQLMCSPNSPYVKRGLSGDELHRRVMENINLDHWTPDDVVETAISFYKIEGMGIVTKLLISMLNSFNNSNKIIDKINDINKRDLNKPNITDEEIETLLKRQVTLTDVSGKISVQIEKLDKIIEQSKLEQKKKTRVKAGGELTSSMMAD